jgi:DNA-binding transcriptional LysR family regulator
LINDEGRLHNSKMAKASSIELDPRRLLTLQAVARYGGVSGAAHALRVTPSAVSQQLQALEQHAGVTLFDRSERSLRLTPAGELLLSAAAQIEDALDHASAELGRRQQAIEGTVVIGAFQSAIISLIGPALNGLREAHPRLVIKVRELTDAALAKAVLSGELDLATSEVRLGSTIQKRLTEVPVLEDPWEIVVPASWRIRTVQQLLARPWISTVDDARADALAQLASIHGFTPMIAHECVEYPSVLALVAVGAGAAVVPALALKLFGSHDVKRFPSPGLGSRTITLIHRVSRKEPTAAVSAVIEAISDRAAIVSS